MATPTCIGTARYGGRRLTVSGPHRPYPSGVRYYRCLDPDAEPRWIPAAHLSNLRPGDHRSPCPLQHPAAGGLRTLMRHLEKALTAAIRLPARLAGLVRRRL